MGSGHIERKLYAKDDETPANILDVLLRERKVLLLGEAGFGKTHEALELLERIRRDERTRGWIAFYLPLHEHGVLYQNIFDGIVYKLNPFCDGNPEELMKEWLSGGKLVLILDGMDDIAGDNMRARMIADARNIMQQYDDSYVLVTGRSNRYHGEWNSMRQYFLSGLSRKVIDQQLREEGIYTELPERYYQLFENPLFFKAGKMVLKKHGQRELFNRSVLMDELTALLYEEWDRQKGLPDQKQLSRSKMLSILGKFAYATFTCSSYTVLEFEEGIGKLVSNGNLMEVIQSLLNSGLLKVSDRVTFLHKLFKEYCTAYYLVTEMPLEENRPVYLKLVQQDEWKETMIFAAGMFRTLEEQDAFLDFIMENNLGLYVECVKAKGDLNPYNMEMDSFDLAKRYLEQILHTYTGIVSQYFGELKRYFDPKAGRQVVNSETQRICIVGHLNPESKWLQYWFEPGPMDRDAVTCLVESQVESAHSDFRARAYMEGRSIRTSGINLTNAGLEGDSGRKIAIDHVKRELEEIFENRLLKESKYLLCEQINDSKNKLSELRDETDLHQMLKIVENMIADAKKESPNMAGYSYNHVDMLRLQELLYMADVEKADFIECVLPEEDLRLPETGGAWIWDLYSKAQTENRISDFFYFHQLSYLEMVKKNFPALYEQFGRYQDMPYQMVIQIEYRDQKEGRGFFSEPGICV